LVVCQGKRSMEGGGGPYAFTGKGAKGRRRRSHGTNCHLKPFETGVLHRGGGTTAFRSNKGRELCPEKEKEPAGSPIGKVKNLNHRLGKSRSFRARRKSLHSQKKRISAKETRGLEYVTTCFLPKSKRLCFGGGKKGNPQSHRKENFLLHQR